MQRSVKVRHQGSEGEKSDVRGEEVRANAITSESKTKKYIHQGENKTDIRTRKERYEGEDDMT